MNVVQRFNNGYARRRGVRALSGHLARLLPTRARVLHVQCGDGLLGSELMVRRPDLSVTGVDVRMREYARLAVLPFDGHRLPFPDRSVDVVLFVDALHGASDPAGLLLEARRIATRAVVVRDRAYDGGAGGAGGGGLRPAPRAARGGHGEGTAYQHCWPRQRWLNAFADLGFAVVEWRTAAELYGPPDRWVLGGAPHFLARLERRNARGRVLGGPTLDAAPTAPLRADVVER